MSPWLIYSRSLTSILNIVFVNDIKQLTIYYSIQEKVEDTKGVNIRSHTIKWKKKNKKTNNCKKKPQRLNNTKPLKTPGELGCSRSVSSSCSTGGTRHVTFVTSRWMSCMRKGPDCDYNKRNISVLICDTDILVCFSFLLFSNVLWDSSCLVVSCILLISLKCYK